jgi:hypothetical protein
MNEIRRVLKQASLRLMLVDLLRTLAVTLAAAVGALIIALFVERIFGAAVSWIELAWICAAAAVVLAVGWSLFRRHRGVALARELDERANLKETLSTAMCVASSDDPWARVVLETARERAVGVNVRQAIPITAPRVWPLPLAMALALTVLWFSVPHWDVMGLFNKRQAAAEQEKAKIQATSESKEAQEKVLEKLRQAGMDLKLEEAGTESDESKTPQDPDAIRRSAVKKLTAAVDQLKDMKSGEKQQQLQALKDAMKQLKQPGPGPLDQLSKSLAQGDFKKAQEDLQELSKQLASDSLSKEQKEQLQQQMGKLQEQLEKAAENRQDIEKQLEKAGMSKEQAQKAAKDPAALQKAMEELENLSDEQKQQLLKKMQAQLGACKQCDGMGESLSKMAKGMSPNGMNAEGMEGMEGLSGQLSELEMASAEMDAMDAATSEALKQLAKMASKCQGGKPGDCNGQGECEGCGSCNSPWKAGETAGKFGNGSGGPGQGHEPRRDRLSGEHREDQGREQEHGRPDHRPAAGVRRAGEGRVQGRVHGGGGELVEGGDRGDHGQHGAA